MQYEGPSCHGLGALNFQSQGWCSKRFVFIFVSSCLESYETCFALDLRHIKSVQCDPGLNLVREGGEISPLPSLFEWKNVPVLTILEENKVSWESHETCKTARKSF